jgi:hypothetical protein
LLGSSNSDDETNFGVCIAVGDANPKIGFLKDSLQMPFKKLISIMRMADEFHSKEKREAIRRAAALFSLLMV